MNNTLNRSGHKGLGIAAWILAFLGAMICLGVAISFSLNQITDLWPVPGFYFIEIVGLGFLGFFSLFKDHAANEAPLFWKVIPWITGGVLITMTILGIFSIGIFLFPAMIAFLLVGVFKDLIQKRNILPNIGIAMLAALVQGGIVYLFLLIMGST